MPNTFFLYSINYEYYDTITGKTLGPGTCVEVTGEIELIQSVTFMDLDDAADNKKFRFSDDPNDCK